MGGGTETTLHDLSPGRLATTRLAVLSDDETLAARAAATLERDGLVVRVEAAGSDLADVERFGRRPNLMLVRSGDRPTVEAALRWARRRLPAAVVVVVLPAGEDPDAAGLLALGADGLLDEQHLDAGLGAVVRAAASGQVSVPARLRAALQPPELSRREREVLALAVAGLTNAQIAERLVIAESTVKTHLTSAFRRIGVRSRREAATLVLASDELLRRSVLGP
jgi:DNA-binding NarL/FixJ family response regulator